MEITGITAEFDPFHNGHRYLIDAVRSSSGCGAVAVAMSGDFVQRGGPAVFDKWTRASHALKCGADLVVEIPVLFCLSNAGQYAKAAIRLLESAGCTRIAFGSECGDAERLSEAAAVLDRYREEISSYISSHYSEGMSFPAAREAAVRYFAGEDFSDILSSPNDILAVEYIRNMDSAVPYTVKRRGAGYRESEKTDDVFQSASALRTMMMRGTDISGSVPVCVAEASETCQTTFREDWFDILRYAVISASPDMIDDCPSGGEGLGNLIKEKIMTARSFDDLVLSVKSKKYTYTRISRLCIQIILGITRQAYPMTEPGYMRVLGFTDKGRQILSGLRGREEGLSVITNINKNQIQTGTAASKLLELDVHAADIYNLVTGRDISAYSDHRIKPIYASGAALL